MSDFIALVGQSGVGKTTLGRRLAETLEFPFWDMDVEERSYSGFVPSFYESMSIAEQRILMRQQIILKLISRGPGVLATGYEDFFPDVAYSIISRYFLTVWVKNRNPRWLGDSGPLAAALTDGATTIGSLSRWRDPLQWPAFYGDAEITVDIGNLSIDLAASKLANTIIEHRAAMAKK